LQSKLTTVPANDGFLWLGNFLENVFDLVG
jgi:hypothetical protein